MVFQPPSMGVAAQLGMGASSPVTEAYEFLSENLALDHELLRTEGLRGTRLHPAERVRLGRQLIGGTIVMQPTYAELVNLLPRIVSAAQAGAGLNTYTVSDTQPAAFAVSVDRGAKVFTYAGCRCGRATFRSGVGQPMELALEVEALSESQGNAGTFPSLTVSATPPFIYADAALTLGGATYQVHEWETTIDWHLKTDRFANNVSRTDLPSMDLTVTARFLVPFTSDTAALYDAGGGVSGVTGSVNLTYLGAGGGGAGVNLQFSYANLIFPARKSPTVAGRDEINLSLEAEARKSGSTAPLVVTLDSTP